MGTKEIVIILIAFAVGYLACKKFPGLIPLPGKSAGA